MTEETNHEIPEEVIELLEQINKAALKDELVLVQGVHSENGRPIFLICRAESKDGVCGEIRALAEIPENGPGEHVILPIQFKRVGRDLH